MSSSVVPLPLWEVHFSFSAPLQPNSPAWSTKLQKACDESEIDVWLNSDICSLFLRHLLHLLQHVRHVAQTTNTSCCGNDRFPCTFCSFWVQTVEVFFSLQKPFLWKKVAHGLLPTGNFCSSTSKFNMGDGSKHPQPNNCIEPKVFFKELTWLKCSMQPKLQILFLWSLAPPLNVTSCHLVPLLPDLSPVKAVDRGGTRQAEIRSPSRSVCGGTKVSFIAHDNGL